jgi:hypothetical protein
MAGLESQKGEYIFLFCTAYRMALRTTNGYRGIFPQRKKFLEQEADYSPPFTAKTKNSGDVLLLPHKSSWRGA